MTDKIPYTPQGTPVKCRFIMEAFAGYAITVVLNVGEDNSDSRQ